jgi:DNA-binding NtrC family response regulator
MEVESTPGVGTVFEIYFPATAPEPVVEKPSAPAPAPVASAGGETLLLVDDEVEIRELATITLESHGYRVLSAGNAEDAIVVAEQHVGEIQALITDVVMPGMSGVQLAEVVAGLIPGLRVLFVSGHSNESISEETLLTAHADYLQKPYLGDTLAAKIREVLAGGEARLPQPSIEHFTPWTG